MKNWTKAIEIDLNQVKKAGTLLWHVKEGNSCPKYADRNPVMASNRSQITVSEATNML